MIAFLILALQDPAVERVLAEYTKARPAEKELAIYTLDWAPGLKEAKERKRPICLFVVTNSYGNLYTGHCWGNATQLRGLLARNLDVLDPFAIAAWNGAEKEMPADIAELFKNVENRGNVFVLILDAEGKFVHGFPGTPPKRDPDYFRTEIAKAKMEFPKEHKKLAGLPDGKGVRLFIRSRSDLPIVEMAPMKDLFAYPDAEREIDAAELREWFAHFYPPAIRTADQSKPFQTVTGRFKLRAAGADEKARYAILGGEFRMTKGDDGESAFEGSLGAVVTYAKDKPEMVTLRGAVDGVYLYRQRGEQRIPLAAALESR